MSDQNSPDETSSTQMRKFFDNTLLFTHCSDAAIACIMWTQTKAREHELRTVGEDVLLLSVAMQPNRRASDLLAQCNITSAFVDEYLSKLSQPGTYQPGAASAFTTEAKATLSAAIDLGNELQSKKVEPEHILYALLESSTKAALDLLTQKGADVELLKSNLGRLLRIDEFILRTIRPAARLERPQKTLDEWFTKESIKAVTLAQDSASSEGKNTVCIDHLLAALIDANPWVPADVATKLRGLLTYARGEGDSASADASFSPRVVKAFLEAKNETSRRAAGSVAPEHLLLGAVKVLTNPETMSADESRESLYDTLKNAYVNHVNELARNKPRRAESLPLVVDEHIVRATVRLVDTLKRARNHARSIGERNIGVPQLILALIEEARISEVPFISNRTDSLTKAQVEIKKLTANQRNDSDVITSIVVSAAEHAQRLCSQRLDINHLALALLDDSIEDESVAVVIRGLGDGSSRLAVRKRLEQCLLWQGAQEAYQAEVGIAVDLQKLHLLLSDG